MRSGDVIAERYRLVDLIGSGGMGIVWLADDLQREADVARRDQPMARLRELATAFAGPVASKLPS